MGELRLNGISYSGAISDKDVYSTEEKVVGEWIDGKPIYRKVVKGTLVSNVPVIHTFNDEINVVSINGTAYSSAGNQMIVNSYSTGGCFTVYLKSDKKTLTTEAGTTFVGKEYCVIVEYTKNAD